ncbi:hypothetical protein [Paenibacillus bouchesdurhonensis]|uniref:hypothetical protein n=1 Tax=Paenibacillus bouchesdurhonensis TaxID=1870990 RepID=UPI000DA635DB|nr:hypothetical protein [Paenibacillus bouchesdurhonensis]
MAQIKALLQCELDPFNPVPEICQVIDAMIANNQMYEDAILLGVIESAQNRLRQLDSMKSGGAGNGTE